ncbi:VanZ like family protein [Psychrobacillus sp. OK028]|uniref:VanZ family protein n=1 Tax=Psychrobacillus sp. OK028 TaxID=1884359 RepID=UPI000884A275|nr:VanZ family protein [Psychrobacillus sp. OK028]SDM39593.1 VanZ like family protein [Psychrobacillus sp. OK028]
MRKYTSLIILLFWLGIIFFLSNQLASSSNALSKEVTGIIVTTAEVINPDTDLTLASLNNTVRKNAHFFIYFILAMLLMDYLRYRGKIKPRNIVFVFLFCVLFAVSDEIHQLFVDGRGGQVKDILIDSSGALTGIGMYLPFYWLRSSRKTSKNVIE